MGQAKFMKCTVEVHSLNFLYGHAHFYKKMPHLSLDSLGKEAYLPSWPAGGAVEKNWQLVSPVTMPHQALKKNLA